MLSHNALHVDFNYLRLGNMVQNTKLWIKFKRLVKLHTSENHQSKIHEIISHTHTHTHHLLFLAYSIRSDEIWIFIESNTSKCTSKNFNGIKNKPWSCRASAKLLGT